MGNLEPYGRLLPRNRLQTRHRTQDPRPGEKFAQFLSELLRLFDGAINNNQALASLLRTLHRDGARRATRSQNHDSQITKIDRELLANRTRESFSIGVVAAQFCIL